MANVVHDTGVLLSGGIDSLVCAEMALAQGRLACVVFVDYGHPAQIQEGWKAFSWAGRRGVRLIAPHVRDLHLGDMSARAGARVVPARNAVLLSVAANVLPHGLSLTIGATRDDAANYPDCRSEFVAAMALALDRQIESPLIDRDKADVVRMARLFGLTSDDAWSCYDAGPAPCGTCPCCVAASAAWSKHNT